MALHKLYNLSEPHAPHLLHGPIKWPQRAVVRTPVPGTWHVLWKHQFLSFSFIYKGPASPLGLSTTLWGRQSWYYHPHFADKKTEVPTDEQGDNTRSDNQDKRSLGFILSLLNINGVFLVRWDVVKIPSVPTQGWPPGCFSSSAPESPLICSHSLTLFNALLVSPTAYGADVRLGLEGKMRH